MLALAQTALHQTSSFDLSLVELVQEEGHEEHEDQNRRPGTC